MKVGLLIIDEDPDVAIRVAKAADTAQVHSIWSIDYYNRSSLARAGAFAAVTETSFVGTSVTPIFARAPLALASAATDIQGLARGRFVLGVGSSTRRMNSDWYGIELEHPAPRVAERLQLIRSLMAHEKGPFTFRGRFETVSMAHFDHEIERPISVPILLAGVGERMIRAAGRVADGFVGHPIASAQNLREFACPALGKGVSEGRGRSFLITSQVIAVVDEDIGRARRLAAQQVGFYATVKGYDALFPNGQHAGARDAARKAFATNDSSAVAKAAETMVDERAVFGTADQVNEQLHRYDAVADWLLLYPPHYGVKPSDVTANELALIEVASAWQDQ